MKTPAPFRRITGFSAVEVIVCVVLIGILGALAIAYMPDAVSGARDKAAVAAAQGINAAQQSYLLRVSGAQTAWTGAANDAARFLLIRQYIPYASAQTEAQYIPAGYTFVLGASLNTRVSITNGPNGAVTY